MKKKIPIALVGLGKIAREQHIPTLEASTDFELKCLISRSSSGEKYPVFRSLKEALQSGPEFRAVSICTPPQVRVALAEEAMRAGCAVLVEKPPAKTVSSAKALIEISENCGNPLFFAWHSRFAPYVNEARLWASNRKVVRVRITWKEDAEKWHPGQHWLWEPGGFGVFDPGINALSILSYLLPGNVQVDRAQFTAEASAQTPVASQLNFTLGSASVACTFDFRERDTEIWSIKLVDDSNETLEIHSGGAEICIDGGKRQISDPEEYKGVYRKFAEVVRTRQSDIDIKPLEIIADAFLIAKWSRS